MGKDQLDNLKIRGGVEDTRLEVKAKDTKKFRGQGQDSPSEDRPSRGHGRNARGQGQGPRTQAAGVVKKKGLHKNFSGDLKKKRSFNHIFSRAPENSVFNKIFQALYKILTYPKIVLSSSQGQGNFQGLEASKQRTSKHVLEDSTSAKNK